MNKERAEGLVTFYLYKYKLLQNGWRFSWHNKKVSLGTCSYNKKRIYLAKWYVELNDEDEVTDTILHEVAHALAYQRHGSAGHGHGRIWKSICVEIGARPERLHTGKLGRPKNHHKYVDTCCGVTYKRHRLRKMLDTLVQNVELLYTKEREQKMADRATKELLDEIFSS